MFKYNYVADLFDRLVKNANYPMQVELHPGSHCGGMRCRYCYGKNQKLNEGLLTIEDYYVLFEDIKDKTNLIDISGIISDPLSYPYIYELIELIKEKQYNFGIHTKGLLLNDRLSELLNYGKTEDNFITISIDSAIPQTYNRLHGLPNKTKFFEQTLEQFKFLKNIKENNNSSLRINVGYLLFKDNSSQKEIERFIEIFEPLADFLRFSIPQVPNQVKPIGFIPKDKIKSKLKLLKKYESSKIIILKFDYSEHDRSFNTCWSQRFNMTIDKAGYMFPCPQVANSVYNHISYGHLHEQTIWEVWNSKKRKEVLGMSVDSQMRCRVCDRKDENINIELEKILRPEKYL